MWKTSSQISMGGCSSVFFLTRTTSRKLVLTMTPTLPPPNQCVHKMPLQRHGMPSAKRNQGPL